LSGSIFKMMIMNSPLYLQQTLCFLLIFTSVYIWTDNPLITASVIAILKISDNKDSYGYNITSLASLASIMLSVLFLNISRSIEHDMTVGVLISLSFIIYSASSYLFCKKEPQIRPNTTIKLIALNTTGLVAYFGIKNVYVLMLLALILFSGQIITGWIIPSVNSFKKMQVGSNIVIISSFSIILLTLIWTLITRGGL